MFMQFRISISLSAIFVALLAFPLTTFAQQIHADGKRKIVTQVAPVYPPIARNLRLSGTVRLYATVAPAGKVVRTEVIGGNPLLAQAATNAVSKFTWEPNAEETRELVEINFRYMTN